MSLGLVSDNRLCIIVKTAIHARTARFNANNIILQNRNVGEQNKICLKRSIENTHMLQYIFFIALLNHTCAGALCHN